MTTAEKKAAKPRPAWWPKKLTPSEWQQLEYECGGICLACGELKDSDCEPDARNYPCDDCGRSKVFGAEEARMMGAIEVEEASKEESARYHLGPVPRVRP